MLLIKQCSALRMKIRCPNPTMDDDKMQCEDHYPKAIKLYIKYKKLCETADTFDIEEVEEIKLFSQKIAFLHECYISYMKAYNARMKHRNYAIAPECEDYGHDLQFSILKEKMVRCEEKLEKLYYKIALDKEINSSEQSEEDNNETKEEEPSILMETIDKFKERRLQDEKETVMAIEDYIKENKQILKTTNKYINIIYDRLMRFIPKKSKYVYQIMMTMVYLMIKIVYKNSNLKKKKLYPYNNIKNIQAYQEVDGFKISDGKMHTYTSLKDVLKDAYSPQIITMKEFLESMDEWSIEIFNKIVETWQNPPPIGPNTMFMYIIRGYNFEFMIMEK